MKDELNVAALGKALLEKNGKNVFLVDAAFKCNTLLQAFTDGSVTNEMLADVMVLISLSSHVLEGVTDKEVAEKTLHKLWVLKERYLSLDAQP